MPQSSSLRLPVIFLKSKGRQPRIQDLDRLVEIEEKKIDKIFEKIFAYKNTIQNENPEDGVAITDEKITTVPNGGEENQQPELQDSEVIEQQKDEDLYLVQSK